jgi:hypothetical protein
VGPGKYKPEVTVRFHHCGAWRWRVACVRDAAVTPRRRGCLSSRPLRRLASGVRRETRLPSEFCSGTARVHVRV